MRPPAIARPRLPDAAEIRFEILPVGDGAAQAAALPGPVRLTVSCSPRLGPDHSVAVGAQLRGLGHAVTVHIAARMVRDAAHLDTLLLALAQAGIDDAFIIGGDADPPAGPYDSAEQLVALVDAHPRRPVSIGVAGYPEGHPLIAPDRLRAALLAKAGRADYVTTQLCFHRTPLRRWIGELRTAGVNLPVFVGMPGQVTPARLIEMSARIGVGPSVAFLRKQRGLRDLLGMLRHSTADRLLAELMPLLDEPELGVAGLHLFTFNQLLATYRWERAVQRRTPGQRPLRETGRADTIAG